MTTVLDACAMMAALRMEDGAQLVRAALRSSRCACYAHSLNVCEVYYAYVRDIDTATARRAVDLLQRAGIEFREDLDRAFWKDVGHLKAGHKVSIADAVCLALARRLGAELLTSDHHEFDALVPKSLCQIRFIR